MEEHPEDGQQQYGESYSRLSSSRDMMSPEVIKSFNEFSQLLHNINIKMASQNDQNLALLQSLESLPSIIRDIPRARELEGDILQEISILLKTGQEDKLRMSERLLDIKSAMMAMEENAKAQISFFEGKERAHRDQMNMMREFIEREKKHHRNNLTGIVFIVMLFIGILCAGAFFFIREKLNGFEQQLEMKAQELEMKSGAGQVSPSVTPNNASGAFGRKSYGVPAPPPVRHSPADSSAQPAEHSPSGSRPGNAPSETSSEQEDQKNTPEDEEDISVPRE